MLPAHPVRTSLSKHGIIIHRGDPESWDGGMIECPVVWYDRRARKYGMVYTGYRLKAEESRKPFGYESVTEPQIGLAWSDDLLRWVKDENNPILTASGIAGTPDSHGASGPFLVPPEVTGYGSYALMYFGVTGHGYEGGLKSLNIAWSETLYDWRRSTRNPVISPSHEFGVRSWRRDAIWHPNVVREDGNFYCFFNASGETGGVHEERIGYATSPDLETWTVHDEQCPILSGSGLAGSWDASGRAGDPCVFRIGDTYWMAYYSWDNVNTQDGLAYTSVREFPIGWTPWPSNPVLRIGPAGTFDSLHAGKPFVFRTETTHFHFYTAVDDHQTREIAVATAPV